MILGILGSPRKGGNSDILLNEVLRAARSKGAATRKICLGDLLFKGCIGCGGCDKTGECVLADDMTPIYAKLRDADAVVLSCPIYFSNITSQLKAMIDRCQSEWVARYKLKIKNKKSKIKNRRLKKGAFICVAGYKKDIFFKCAKKPVEAFFKTMDMVVVDELFFGGVDKAGDIKKIKLALKEAYQLGIRLADNK